MSESVGTLLSAVKPERVQWFWPGRIARGKVTLIDGDPDRGKSVLSIDFAARLSTGRAWPDRAPCPRGGVVILSAEDGLADTIRPRLDAADGDATRVLALDLVGSDRHPVTLPNDLGYVEAAIQRVGALVVVVDPLMAYLHGDVNAHRDQDVRKALRPLKEFAERLGVAIIVIRHLNKSAGSPAIYRGGGSIGIIGAARIGLVVGLDPRDDGRHVLAPLKSNLSAPPPALAYRLVGASNEAVKVSWEGVSDLTADQLVAVQTDSPEDAGALAEAQDFLRGMLADGPMPSKDVKRLAKDAGVTEITLRRARQALGVRIDRDGFGKSHQSLWAMTAVQPESHEDPSLSDDSDFASLAAEESCWDGLNRCELD